MTREKERSRIYPGPPEGIVAGRGHRREAAPNRALGCGTFQKWSPGLEDRTALPL